MRRRQSREIAAIAQAGEKEIRRRKVGFRSPERRRYDGVETGTLGRGEPDGGILERDAIRSPQAQFCENELVDIGRRLLAAAEVACGDHLEPVDGLVAERMVQQGIDVGSACGRCDGKPQAGGARLCDESLDAVAQRYAPGGDEPGVVAGLAALNDWNSSLQSGPISFRNVQQIDEMRDPLPPAGDFQQFTIDAAAPAPGKAMLCERSIECLSMRLLAVGQRAVHVEDERAQAHGTPDGASNTRLARKSSASILDRDCGESGSARRSISRLAWRRRARSSALRIERAF